MKAIIVMSLYIYINHSIKIESYPFIEIERATTYYCEESQCDNDPLTTADGSVIDVEKLKRNELRWCALSRDLIWDEHRQDIHDAGFRGLYEFGDTIFVMCKSNPHISGKWVIHDTMNERYTNSIDFLIHPDNNNPKLGVCDDVMILKPNYTAYTYN